MLKVVVVEDAALVRKGLIMTTSWEQNQCEVVGSAANGIEGEKLILEKRPNIVITDIRLPLLPGRRISVMTISVCRARAAWR